jgi:predicted dienelactone hydrolase
MSGRVAPLVLLAFLLPVAPARATCPIDVTTASFGAPGPYGVGVRTLTLVDHRRATPAHGLYPALPARTLVTEVWYPIAPGSTDPVRDVPLATGGPFPLVVSSHGYFDNRLGETYYTTLLASRGFVVAAPTFPLTSSAAPGGPDTLDTHNQPGDVRFVITQLLRLGRDRSSWLTRGIDRRRIGAAGLSLGGLTTYLATYHPFLRDPRIKAALPIAGLSCAFTQRFYGATRRPLLILHGDQDLLLPFTSNAERSFAGSRAPRTLVELVDATHTAFAAFITFPSNQSYDVLAGCPVVAGIGDLSKIGEGLGGTRAGIDFSGCTVPCLDPAPPNPPMQATHQHDLTKAVVAAFFEATLEGSATAQCFLDERLAAENADVHVTTHARGP